MKKLIVLLTLSMFFVSTLPASDVFTQNELNTLNEKLLHYEHLISTGNKMCLGGGIATGAGVAAIVGGMLIGGLIVGDDAVFASMAIPGGVVGGVGVTFLWIGLIRSAKGNLNRNRTARKIMEYMELNAYTVTINGLGSDLHLNDRRYTLIPQDENIPQSDLLFAEISSSVRWALGRNGYAYVENIEDANLVVLLDYGSEPVLGNLSKSSIRLYCVTAVSYQTGAIDALWETSISCEHKVSDLRNNVPYMLAAAYPSLGKNTGQIIETTIMADNPDYQEIISE